MVGIEFALTMHQTDIQQEIARDFVFIKSATRFEKVKLADIEFIQADGSYTRFVTATKEYKLSKNLTCIISQIKNPSFLRIHRSFVINLDNVTGLNNDHVFIREKNLPISRSFKEDVNRILNKLS